MPVSASWTVLNPFLGGQSKMSVERVPVGDDQLVEELRRLTRQGFKVDVLPKGDEWVLLVREGGNQEIRVP